MNDMFQKEEVLPYMKGLWREALQSVCGLPSSVFNKKHQSCPSCGGKDRFRWTDNLNNPGDGGAYCNSCGADKGEGWMMRLTGEPYSEVINILGRFLGKVPQEYRVKANKRASRDNGYKFGAQAEHERCEAVMSRTELLPETNLSVFECITAKSFNVGFKPRENGADEEIIAVPCHMVHDDGLDDEMTNIMYVYEDSGCSFLAKDYTRGSVCCINKKEDGNVYMVESYVDAHRVAMITNQEVWVFFEPSNLEIVSFRYKGPRELRLVCQRDDLDALYMADEREMKVMIPNGGSLKMGLERVLYDAEYIINQSLINQSN